MKIIIMAGGEGTRLWPKSVKDKPKQFHSLLTGETMLQNTYRRISKLMPANKIFIVTARKYSSLVKDQVPELKSEQLIIEPFQRDTGPCVALVTSHFLLTDAHEVIVMMPADHYVSNICVLFQVLNKAEIKASQNRFIGTIGIVPNRPDPHYGYIIVSPESDDDKEISSRAVVNFIEKPNLAGAKKLLALRNVYWNSGMIIAQPATLAETFEKYQAQLWKQIKINKLEDVETEYFRDKFAQLPKMSFDFGILEKTNDLFMVPYEEEWEDLGSWLSFERIHAGEVDELNNVVQGDVHLYHSHHNLIISENQEVVTVGIQNLIVIATTEGILICDKSLEGKLKKIRQEIERFGGKKE